MLSQLCYVPMTTKKLIAMYMYVIYDSVIVLTNLTILLVSDCQFILLCFDLLDSFVQTILTLRAYTYSHTYCHMHVVCKYMCMHPYPLIFSQPGESTCQLSIFFLHVKLRLLSPPSLRPQLGLQSLRLTLQLVHLLKQNCEIYMIYIVQLSVGKEEMFEKAYATSLHVGQGSEQKLKI